MHIINQCEDWVKFNTGEVIFREELQELFKKVGINQSLDELMLEQDTMVGVAEVFPFIDSDVSINLIKENPFRYFKIGNSEIVVSFYDVVGWVGKERKEEVREHINWIYRTNKEYSYLDAIIDIASIYFNEKIRTYLIWNI